MTVKYTRQEAIAKGMPTCFGSVCKKHPELEGFRRVSGACVQCAKETCQRNRKKSPEKVKAWNKNQYERLRQNKEFVDKKRELDRQYQKQNQEKTYVKTRAWLAEHPEKAKTYAAKHRKNNPGAKNADTAKRRAVKIFCTPKWLNEDHIWAIKEAYLLAALRTKLFGFSWHVDHIIPLRGKHVSGLHVPWNLQVIPAVDNIRKGNKVQVS
jgi:hypothetical protein